MRTVVINTSKEVKNTNLDILFRAPFDQNSLLWYDNELAQLDVVAGEIKRALVTDADTVDKDYNLIVLVDLYSFPFGNEKNTTEVYKLLLKKYIVHVLKSKLCADFNLPPMGTSLYFIDSAKYDKTSEMKFLFNNPTDQQKFIYDKNFEEDNDRDRCNEEGLPDEDAILGPEKEKKHKYKLNEDIFMELFSWSDNMKKTDFSWKLKISDDQYLDFSEVFINTATEVANSDPSVDIVKIALDGCLNEKTEDMTGSLPVNELVYFIDRENEQIMAEGFFGLFANVFTCVQTKKLAQINDAYDSERIKDILNCALKKYRHFSKDENIDIKFESVNAVFEKREDIFRKRKDSSGEKSEDIETIVGQIMNETNSGNVASDSENMRGIDAEFYELEKQILRNYDEEIIQKQNNSIVKKCLSKFWSWRDKQTNDGFRKIVSDVVKNGDGECAGQYADLIKDEYNVEREKIVDKITNVELELVENKNILMDTKEMARKYGELVRKGRFCKLSYIGAIISVIASIFPYIYTEYYGSGNTVELNINFIFLVALFSVLYAFAISLYSRNIHRKKRDLLDKLTNLKNESEDDRRKSITALCQYYLETTIEAENYYLLWREIIRRDKENAKKGSKRSVHKKRLKTMINVVERFMTKLKMDISEDLSVVNDEESCEIESLTLHAEQSPYNTDNQKVYSILKEKVKQEE